MCSVLLTGGVRLVSLIAHTKKHFCTWYYPDRLRSYWASKKLPCGKQNDDTPEMSESLEPENMLTLVTKGRLQMWLWLRTWDGEIILHQPGGPNLTKSILKNKEMFPALIRETMYMEGIQCSWYSVFLALKTEERAMRQGTGKDMDSPPRLSGTSTALPMSSFYLREIHVRLLTYRAVR